jgi:hypothetical protein
VADKKQVAEVRKRALQKIHLQQTLVKEQYPGEMVQIKTNSNNS